MTDLQKTIAAGEVAQRGNALALAAFHGGYGLLLLWFGTTLWALPTYDTAKAVPGGVLTWAIVAVLASALLVVGALSDSYSVTAVGATVSALWLAFFAVGFFFDALNDPTPVALPGVLAYSCLATFATIVAGTAAGRR